MPRLPLIDPRWAEGRVKEILEGPLKGKHLNIFKGMANSPAVLDAYLAMAGSLGSCALTGKEREVIQLAVSEANECACCTAAHTAIGKSQGLTDAQCLGARRGSVTDAPKLDAVAKFALAIHEKHGQVTDDDIRRFLASGYTHGHVAEVVATYALAIFTNYFNHVNKTEVDFPAVPTI